MNDDFEPPRKNGFNARFVDLVRITSAFDIEIVIAECEAAIANIDRQFKEYDTTDYDYRAWAADAVAARNDIIFKRDLAVKKLEGMRLDKEEKARKNFYYRFWLACKNGELTQAEFHRISDKVTLENN